MSEKVQCLCTYACIATEHENMSAIVQRYLSILCKDVFGRTDRQTDEQPQSQARNITVQSSRAGESHSIISCIMARQKERSGR